MFRYVFFSLGVFLPLIQGHCFAQVVINEIQASNSSTIEDADGDSSDWLELYNHSDSPYDLGGHGISDDPEEPMKWVFPSFRLQPGERLIVWCSGKDLRFPSQEQLLRTNSLIEVRPTILDLDQEWSYLSGPPDSGEPPDGWNQANFDDSTWARGQPGFGFGDDDDRTELESGNGATFLRTSFDVENLADSEGMVLQVNYDDGFVAWLNGTRILSINFPENTEPTFNSNATRSREARAPQRWMAAEWADLLRPKDNLLAVALLNRTHRSNDLSFLPEIGFSDPSFHTNFQLDSDGEFILLTTPGRELLDGLNMPRQTEDRSYGRAPDGIGQFAFLFYPTPGEVNDTHTSQQPISSEVTFSPPGGFHNGGVQAILSVNIPFDDFQIRYTTNGTPPTIASTLYTEPVRITRDTVIRAAGFLDGRQALDATAESYFLTGRNFQLPVMSISMNPNDYSQVHNNSGGRGRGSEREAYMEIFDDEGQPAVETGFGLRLHGGAGRGGDFNTKKAYKAYFRGVYGDKKLRYPLIPDTEVEVFDKLVLRSNFNDAIGRNGNGSLLRDQLIRDLHKDMGGFISHGSWYHLFVNMRYRGIYNIVERLDEEYMDSYFEEEGGEGDSAGNWDVIKTGDDVLVGDNREWNRIGTFLQQNNLVNNDAYNEFAEFVDIENFTSYMIVNMWSQNHDWPHNNWYASRSRTANGKWRFFCWDAEFGISLSPGGYSSNTLDHVFGRNGRLADIFRGLANNMGYRRYFNDQVESYLNGPLSPASTRRRMDLLRQRILPDIQHELASVSRSRSQWDNNINTMYNFLRNRNGPFLGFVRSSSRLAPPPDMTPSIRSVTPSEIVNIGDVVVRVRGTRLVRNIQIFFNRIEAEVIDYHGIIGGVSVRVPFDGALSGPVTVSARNPDAEVESEETEGLFTVSLPAPLVTGILPEFGAAGGGDEILLSGGYFFEGITVFFGDQEAPSVTRFGPDADSTVLLRVTTPPGRGEVEVRAVNTRPGRAESADSMSFTYRGAEGYTRGDADASGDINLTDAVLLLNFLFSGGAAPACQAAADTDRSGSLAMTDAIQILNFLFLGAAEFPAPFPDCGQDPLGELLECEASRTCQ